VRPEITSSRAAIGGVVIQIVACEGILDSRVAYVGFGIVRRGSESSAWLSKMPRSRPPTRPTRCVGIASQDLCECVGKRSCLRGTQWGSEQFGVDRAGGEQIALEQMNGIDPGDPQIAQVQMLHFCPDLLHFSSRDILAHAADR
jgi:hypothetical protein